MERTPFLDRCDVVPRFISPSLSDVVLPSPNCAASHHPMVLPLFPPLSTSSSESCSLFVSLVHPQHLHSTTSPAPSPALRLCCLRCTAVMEPPALLCIDASVLALSVVNLGLLIDCLHSAQRQRDDAAPTGWWSVVIYCTSNAVTVLAILLCRAMPAICRLTPLPSTHRLAKSRSPHYPHPINSTPGAAVRSPLAFSTSVSAPLRQHRRHRHQPGRAAVPPRTPHSHPLRPPLRRHQSHPPPSHPTTPPPPPPPLPHPTTHPPPYPPLPLQVRDDGSHSPALGVFFIGSALLLFLYSFAVLLLDCQSIQHAAYALPPPPFAEPPDIRLFGVSLFGGPWAVAFGDARRRRGLSEVEIERVGTLTTFAGRNNSPARSQVERTGGKAAETAPLDPSAVARLDEMEKGKGAQLQPHDGDAASGAAGTGEEIPQVSHARIATVPTAVKTELTCELCVCRSAWCASTRCARGSKCCCYPACTCRSNTHRPDSSHLRCSHSR